MKKIAITAAIVCCLLFSFTSNAAAAFAANWEIVRIENISTGMRLLCKNPSDWSTYFFVEDGAEKNRLLAMALTAMSLGTLVTLEFEIIDGTRTLTGLMLNAQ